MDCGTLCVASFTWSSSNIEWHLCALLLMPFGLRSLGSIALEEKLDGPRLEFDDGTSAGKSDRDRADVS